MAFSVFGINVAWYGIIIGIGFILAAVYVMRRSRQFGLDPDTYVDMLIWALPLCIIGARTYFVLSKWDYYSQHLSEIYKIWEGGLAIYGAVIVAFIVVFVFGRVRKIDILSMLDLGCIGLLIGQFIGRWGNFVNAEAHGGPTSLPWGMSLNGGVPVHPTFLYESLWNFFGFLILHFYSKRRKFRGEICLMYVAWYGLGRFFIEGLRTDSLYLGSTGIRVSQLLAGLSFIVAAGLLAYFHVTKKYPKAFTAKTLKPEEESNNEQNN